MNPKKLEESYQKNKRLFHDYIDNIKRNSPWDLYTIINTTLIKNPYATKFPINFFTNKKEKYNRYTLFIKSSFKFYLKQCYLLFSYSIATILYKLYYKKKRQNDVEIIIDTFGLVDKANKDGVFSENYLTGIYHLFEKFDAKYSILLRPYQVAKNPFKLKQFFKILNDDKKDFIFEYELLKCSDFFTLGYLILLYPFKTLRLLQKENTHVDIIFNNAIIADIASCSFDSFTRYVLGKNLSKIESLQKIFSWSEFQVIERSFNYAIRKNNKSIVLTGLQFFISYETYFNVIVDDLDFDMLCSPHKVLVNGKYYVQKREKVKYDIGVSLRYKNIFNFKGVKKEECILLLGSYVENDTKHMLESVKRFDNVIFKNHPAVDIKNLGKLSKNITVSNENIYKLFENAKLVIGAASGTCIEAVSCGISVIVIASQDNLTANPLVKNGKGEIWDIAFSADEVEKEYKKLINYRNNNAEGIIILARWYKNNFFTPLSNENIIKTFGF